MGLCQSRLKKAEVVIKGVVECACREPLGAVAPALKAPSGPPSGSRTVRSCVRDWARPVLNGGST